MRAILVCVDYSDLLEVTLPWNLDHFEEVMVVSTPKDERTIWAVSKVRMEVGGKIELFLTESFYDNGACFNKWVALEEGLDKFGRQGWLCILDADILWPKNLELTCKIGNLYSPARRIYPDLSYLKFDSLPLEQEWKNYRKFTDYEFAGYSQIFHADDPHLPLTPPWHEIDWKHAGGADSAFQNNWPKENKIRPDWEVLHLGQPGANWCGRVEPYIDGRRPEQAAVRSAYLARYMYQRRKTGNYREERLEG